MKDVPADILRYSYQAVADAGLGTGNDVITLVVAQAMTVERDRAIAHIKAGQAALRKSGDGSVSHIRDVATSIINDIEAAVRSGGGL